MEHFNYSQHIRLNSCDDFPPYRPSTADGPFQAQLCGQPFRGHVVNTKLFILNVTSWKSGTECDVSFTLWDLGSKIKLFARSWLQPQYDTN